jgi:hypothetical protein
VIGFPRAPLERNGTWKFYHLPADNLSLLHMSRHRSRVFEKALAIVVSPAAAMARPSGAVLAAPAVVNGFECLKPTTVKGGCYEHHQMESVP